MTAPTPADVPGQGEVETAEQRLLRTIFGKPTEAEALAEVIESGWEDEPNAAEQELAHTVATNILASDWLAERDAEVARAASERAQSEWGRYSLDHVDGNPYRKDGAS